MNDVMAVMKAGEFERAVDWKKYSIQRVAVSPSLAQRLLARNAEFNRHMRSAVVSMYARDMENGNWNERIGDPIRFSDTGLLIDGQHRLKAIAESGMTVTATIMTGLAESDYMDVDNGAMRSVCDIADIPSGAKGAAIIRAALAIDNGCSIRTCCISTKTAAGISRRTRSDVIDAAERRGDEFEVLIGKAMEMRRVAACGAPRAYGAFLYIAKAVHGDEAAYAFADLFIQQDPIVSPVYNTIRNKEIRSRGAANVTFVIGSLLYSMSLWVAGKATRKNVINKQEATIDKYDELLREIVSSKSTTTATAAA